MHIYNSSKNISNIYEKYNTNITITHILDLYKNLIIYLQSCVIFISDDSNIIDKSCILEFYKYLISYIDSLFSTSHTIKEDNHQFKLKDEKDIINNIKTMNYKNLITELNNILNK